MRRHTFPQKDISHLRKHWDLAKCTVFLNHGSFGACPRAVLELQTELRQQLEAEPVQFLWRRYEERLEPARRELARFIGASRRDVVFVTNATSAVNAVVRSLRLRPGDELLTTDHDYNACRNVLREEARRQGAKVRVAHVPFPIQSEEQVTEAVLRGVNRRTRLAMIDHVTSPTALVFPVRQVIKELEARGIPTLVDGAHAPGMTPLNLKKLGAAYYTGNLHKWICAPKGAAFLWVREDLQKGVLPPVISHGPNTPRPGYSKFQDCFDWTGTFDPTAWMCVGASIRWLNEIYPGGWDMVRRVNRDLAIRARRLLCEKLEVPAPCPEAMLGAMATLPLPERFEGRPKRGRIEQEQLELYDQWGIEVPLVRFGRPSRRYFRISAQLYNSLAEDRLPGQSDLTPRLTSSPGRRSRQSRRRR